MSARDEQRKASGIHSDHDARKEESNTQPMIAGDAWIESPLPQPETNLKDGKAKAAVPTPQANSSKECGPLPRQEHADDRDMFVRTSGRPLSVSSSEARAGSAASGDKGVKRLTETERLLTLWAGDK